MDAGTAWVGDWDSASRRGLTVIMELLDDPETRRLP